jgi:hypothetical protein
VTISATSFLAPSEVIDAPAAGTVGTLRYRGGAAVRSGSFVAVDVGPRTPEGLLGRVVAERSDGLDTVIDIVPASVVEAVPEGSFDAWAPAAAAGSMRVRSAGAAARFFRSAFSCVGDVRAELTGTMAVALQPRFKMKWSFGEVQSAEATATVRGDAALSAAISAAGFCELARTPVATWDAPPLRVAVGPIPVVIVPRTTLYVSGRAEAQAAYETGISGFLSATAGLRYDGAVHPIGSFEHGFSYAPPKLRATAALGGRVIPSITFLVYGQAGPRFDLGTGLQLDANPDSSPWWTLTAPVELSAGLEVPNFDDLSVPQRTVLSRSIPIASAEADAPPAPSGMPGAGPREGAERVRISWDTGATDVDLHVWDELGHHASYTNPGGVPGGTLSEDDRHGFGPELFLDRTGGRTLSYGLCYFDDHGSGPTTVAIRLTDPDGSVRESTQTLTRKGDSVLLGASPAGSGFVPADGWCGP